MTAACSGVMHCLGRPEVCGWPGPVAVCGQSEVCGLCAGECFCTSPSLCSPPLTGSPYNPPTTVPVHHRRPTVVSQSPLGSVCPPALFQQISTLPPPIAHLLAQAEPTTFNQDPQLPPAKLCPNLPQDICKIMMIPMLLTLSEMKVRGEC